MGFVLVTGLSKLRSFPSYLQPQWKTFMSIVGGPWVQFQALLSWSAALLPPPSLHDPISAPRPPVPAPATSQQVCSRAPCSPGLGPIKPGPLTGWCPILVSAWPCPQDGGWCSGEGCAPGCPAHWLGAWRSPGCQHWSDTLGWRRVSVVPREPLVPAVPWQIAKNHVRKQITR